MKRVPSYAIEDVWDHLEQIVDAAWLPSRHGDGFTGITV